MRRRSQAGVTSFATVQRLLYKEKTYRQWHSDQEAGGRDGSWACFSQGGKSRSPWERLRNRDRKRRGRSQRRTAAQRKQQWITPCEPRSRACTRPTSWAPSSTTAAPSSGRTGALRRPRQRHVRRAPCAAPRAAAAALAHSPREAAAPRRPRAGARPPPTSAGRVRERVALVDARKRARLDALLPQLDEAA